MMNQCKTLKEREKCEVAILRQNVDKQHIRLSRKRLMNPLIKKMISIVETFLRKKKLICYGGVSINAMLPKRKQFYNYDIEIPDYDFFSYDALTHAKELADLYAKKGFHEVEAKAGIHHGTYKLFVNFIGIADITQCDSDVFTNLKKEAINKDGILYCPANFLRMSMYLELSRPHGDITRWEKVLKRLNLLNKIYPLKHISCMNVDFQRDMSNYSKEAHVFDITKKFLIEKEVIFFGSFAVMQFSQYMPKRKRKKMEKIPDFDVLSLDPSKISLELKQRLNNHGIENCSIIQHAAIGEIVSSHFQVLVNNNPIVYFYYPLACHSYNEIREPISNKKIKIATIETMMSFYLAFLYTSRPYYDRNRILCMAQYLFEVQQANRLEQKGLLKRFSLNCYGSQLTLDDLRNEKTTKYQLLNGQYGTKEYDEWFLRYRPNEILTQQTRKKK
jgi:hypothetical protein